MTELSTEALKQCLVSQEMRVLLQFTWKLFTRRCDLSHFCVTNSFKKASGTKTRIKILSNIFFFQYRQLKVLLYRQPKELCTKLCIFLPSFLLPPQMLLGRWSVAEAGSQLRQHCLVHLEQRMTICFAKALEMLVGRAGSLVSPYSLTFIKRGKE